MVVHGMVHVMVRVSQADVRVRVSVMPCPAAMMNGPGH